ncbi:MAG: signal peptide peptidase SppA, type [Bacteroidetes bacterium]|nr:signal peptide peptidase SppA, type [Bacteroidota bacterium]
MWFKTSQVFLVNWGKYVDYSAKSVPQKILILLQRLLQQFPNQNIPAMLKFLKYVFATIVGMFLFFLIGIFILIGVAKGLSKAASKGEMANVESNSVLKLNVNYKIPEKSEKSIGEQLGFGGGSDKESVGLYDICELLKKAAKDDKIKGIYIPMGLNPNGLATIEVLRNQLKEFKKSGKFVYAYGEYANQKSYYLCAVADKIYLNPNGGMEVMGFGREIMYYKGALEKLGVEVQDFHCGAFKSAIEPYLRDKMSEPNRQQLTSIYGDVYSQFLTNIGADRKIDTAQLSDIINNLKATLPKEAKELKMIDETAYYDEVETAMREKVGTKKKDDLKLVDIGKYAGVNEPAVHVTGNIAVLCADGEIVDGEGKDGQIGSKRFAKAVSELRKDDKVKAIVLRINSPGGSALASDVMWRELVLAKKEKPLIISFGDVAASGGYYIACLGDRIFAQPNTITGSIGVFGLIPNAKKLLNDKLGITTDKVSVTKHGAFALGTNPLDQEERAMVQKSIERTYREFKERVAEGRKKDTAYIESIAQGHVYTGQQGIQLGLVDEIGGLDQAIAYAAKQANIKEPKVTLYPEEKPWKDRLSESFGNMKQDMVKDEVGAEQYKMYQTLKTISNFYGVQMRMPMELDIQ